MSNDKHVSIENVKQKILSIWEDESSNKTITEVSLDKGEKDGSVTNSKGSDTAVYLGIMTYNDGKKACNIDGVQANFKADKNKGEIHLRLNLVGNNKFVAPLVTTVPADKAATPLHCIKVSQRGDSELDVIFLEPKKGEYVAYPRIYFHTEQGVIDPSIAVKRSV